jgi:hypothetical protein
MIRLRFKASANITVGSNEAFAIGMTHTKAHGSPGDGVDRVKSFLCWHSDVLPLNFGSISGSKDDFGRQIKPVLKLSERKVVALPFWYVWANA